MAMQLDTREYPFFIRCEKYWDQKQANEDIQTISIFVRDKGELETLIENDNILTIFEYQNFSIFFSSHEKESRLIIRGLTKEDIIINPHTDKTFINKDGHITPGLYTFIIKYKGHEYYSALEILPKNMSVEELNNLKKVIEKLGKGLIYNIKYGKEKTLKNEFYKSELYLLDLLEKNINIIIGTANNIINSPLQSLRKNYEERKDRQIIDNKSLRWLMSAKGQCLNSNLENPTVLYQKKTKKSLTNPENKWFLKAIDYISSKLRGLKNKLIIELYSEREKIVKVKFQRDSLIKQLKEMGQSTQFENQRKSIFGRTKRVEENIARIEDLIFILKKDLNRTENLLSKFDYIMNCDIYKANKNFNKVSRPAQYIFRDKRYRKIHHLYEKLLYFHKEEGSFFKTYQFKKTYKLYEYYVLINTIIIIQEYGFKWIRGWIMDQDNRALVSDIEEGQELIFEKDAYQLKITYEGEIIPASENSLMKKRDFFFTLNRNLTPDIRLDLYYDNLLEKSIVIEVKYRQFQSLYNQEFNTNVMTQLSKYRNLEYIDGNGELKRPVAKVIVVYPRDKYMPMITQEKFFAQFIYNQLSPKDSENQYGYEEYKEILGNLI